MVPMRLVFGLAVAAFWCFRSTDLQAQQAEVQPLYQQAKASGLVPQCKA